MLGLTPIQYAVLRRLLGETPPPADNVATDEELEAFYAMRHVGRVRLEACPCGHGHVWGVVTPAGIEAKRIHEASLTTSPGVPP
jgi:hypothetical protein